MSSNNPHKAIQASLAKTLVMLHNHKIGFPVLPRRDSLARLLSAKELELLEIYRRHQELAREITELETGVEEELGRLDLDGDDKDEEELRREVEEAKLKAEILDAIGGHIVAVRPVLEAVYGDGDGRLRNAISQRDTLSTAHAQATASVSDLQTRLHQVTTARLKLDAQNSLLATRISTLWKKLEKDMPTEEQVGDAEKRQEWKDDLWRVRLLRGVIGRVVVGSGIDWADDERWRTLVINCGEE